LRTCGGGGFLFAGPEGGILKGKADAIVVYNYDSREGSSLGFIGEVQVMDSPIKVGEEAVYSFREKKVHFETLGFLGHEGKIRLPGLFGSALHGVETPVLGGGGLVAPSGEIGLYAHIGPVGGGGYVGICAAPDPNP
jgi:hypothetical protein